MKRTLATLMAILFAVLCMPKNSFVLAASSVDEEGYDINSDEKNETMTPCYGEYEFLTDEDPTKGADPKDSYETNNSFYSATRLNSKPSGKPTSFSVSRYATLHRESWLFGLIQRNVDEDYWRIDVFGNATLSISLANIPTGCDYDIQLHKHKNIRYCKEDDIELVGVSVKNGNASEYITKTVTPGTYYIWVYSYNDTSDAYNKYKLSASVTYTSGNNASIAELKYNKGAKAALWVSDFDPCGIKAFENSDKICVGYTSVETASARYENPFLNQLPTNTNIDQAVLYIWDTQLRNAIRAWMTSMYSFVNNELENAKRYKIKIAGLNNTGSDFMTGASIAFQVLTDTGKIVSRKTIAIGSYGLSVIPVAYSLILNCFLEEIDEIILTKTNLLNYIRDIRTALEANGQTGDEVVRIYFKYKMTSESLWGLSQTNYYIDYTQSPQSSYLYSNDNINGWSSSSITNGTIYGITKLSDINKAINHGSTYLPDVNTSTIRTITPNSSIPGTIKRGEYHWFKFTATTAGKYRFYTENSFDTYGELFSEVVPARSTSGRLAYNDNGNGNLNFKIVYTLSAGQTVYLRVRGANWTKTGNYSLRVSKGG